MITCLQFVKTHDVLNSIDDALTIVSGSRKSNKKSKNSKTDGTSNRLQKLKDAEYITLEDAQFIVKILNDNCSESEKHYVHELLSGCDIYKPPPKCAKNPEFEAFLNKLRAKQAKRDYETLIHGNKPSPHEQSLLSMIRKENGVQQWLDYTSIGHLLMIMVGSFLVFFYLAHHVWPHQKEYKIVGGCIGLLFGLIVEFGLMVVKEQKAEMEANSKNPRISMKQSHQRYNQQSIQKVIEAQKRRREERESEKEKISKKES